MIKTLRKRLTTFTFMFFGLFCASAVEVYRGEQADIDAHRKTKEQVKKAFCQLCETERSIELAEASTIRYSAMNYGDDGTSTEDYNRRLLNLKQDVIDAKLAFRSAIVLYDGNNGAIANELLASVKFSGELAMLSACSTSIQADKLGGANNERIARFAEFQENVSPSQLANEWKTRHANHLYQLSEKEELNQQLVAAENEVLKLRQEVQALKEAVAEAKRTSFERWLSLVLAIIAALISLSSNIIGWRQDRRQVREMKLLLQPRHHELEMKNFQLEQQLAEKNRVVLLPSESDLRRYGKFDLRSR